MNQEQKFDIIIDPTVINHVFVTVAQTGNVDLRWNVFDLEVEHRRMAMMKSPLHHFVNFEGSNFGDISPVIINEIINEMFDNDPTLSVRCFALGREYEQTDYEEIIGIHLAIFEHFGPQASYCKPFIFEHEVITKAFEKAKKLIPLADLPAGSFVDMPATYEGSMPVNFPAVKDTTSPYSWPLFIANKDGEVTSYSKITTTDITNGRLESIKNTAALNGKGNTGLLGCAIKDANLKPLELGRLDIKQMAVVRRSDEQVLAVVQFATGRINEPTGWWPMFNQVGMFFVDSQFHILREMKEEERNFNHRFRYPVLDTTKINHLKVTLKDDAQKMHSLYIPSDHNGMTDLRFAPFMPSIAQMRKGPMTHAAPIQITIHRKYLGDSESWWLAEMVKQVMLEEKTPDGIYSTLRAELEHGDLEYMINGYLGILIHFGLDQPYNKAFLYEMTIIAKAYECLTQEPFDINVIYNAPAKVWSGYSVV